MIKRRKIYLDYASTSPIDKEVIKTMYACEHKFFANPSSIHTFGVKVREIIDRSRSKIAELVGAHSDEIIFTGSGTESNALAILGFVYVAKKQNFLPHIITTNIEHPSVLENCKYLEKENLAEVTYVQVGTSGTIDPKEIKKALKENTVLVSVMYANNEIGTIQPIREIAREIRHYRKERIGF